MDCLLLCRRRSTYLRQRHRIVLAQRMLRLMHMLVSVYQSCEGLQEALARALDAEKVAAAAASAPTLRVAVLNLTRPLGLGPLITMSQVSGPAACCRSAQHNIPRHKSVGNLLQPVCCE